MDELKRRLTKELQQDFNVKILDSLLWSLPVHSIDIAYETVRRTKMDILMKMMLIAFGKAEIETAEELSDILLVEQLFIKDLIDKMSRTGLIGKKDGAFVLTTIGSEQLVAGIFEHEPEIGAKKALYSPYHQAFLKGNKGSISAEGKEMYRFHDDFADWVVTSLGETDFVNELKALGVESVEGNVQVVVSKIVAASDMQIDLVPCLEFRLHNTEEDLIYARVWNTLSEQWDETLEAQLNDKERKKWREVYL